MCICSCVMRKRWETWRSCIWLMWFVANAGTTCWSRDEDLWSANANVYVNVTFTCNTVGSAWWDWILFWWLANHSPSVLWCCWLGLWPANVSRVTYTVLVETLNPAHSLTHSWPALTTAVAIKLTGLKGNLHVRWLLTFSFQSEELFGHQLLLLPRHHHVVSVCDVRL